MTIVLNEDTLVHTMWFMTDKKTFDWLGAVLKKKDEPWSGIYRFRYYRDNKAFESADQKTWYELLSPAGSGPEHLVSSLTKVTRVMSDAIHAEVHTLFVNGTGVDAAKAMKREDWAFFKQAR